MIVTVMVIMMNRFIPFCNNINCFFSIAAWRNLLYNPAVKRPKYLVVWWPGSSYKLALFVTVLIGRHWFSIVGVFLLNFGQHFCKHHHCLQKTREMDWVCQELPKYYKRDSGQSIQTSLQAVKKTGNRKVLGTWNNKGLNCCPITFLYAFIYILNFTIYFLKGWLRSDTWKKRNW